MTMRIRWIDSWRGTLIILVVLGHVVGMSWHFATCSTQFYMSLCYKIIYSFHMAAFFALAGILWHEHLVGFCIFAIKKIKRLVIPYLFFGILSAGIYVLCKYHIGALFHGATTDAYVNKGRELWWMPFLSILQGGGWPNGQGFQCNSVLWFLPAMFTLEMLFFWIDKFAKKNAILTIVLIASFLVWFFSQKALYCYPWGIGKLFCYLPYFIVGRIIGSFVNSKRKVKSKCVIWVIFGVLLFLHVGACFFTPDRMVIRLSFMWAVAFFGIAIIGICASAFFSFLFDSACLQMVGRASLVIMLLHKFVMLVFLNVLPIAGRLKQAGIICSSMVIVVVSALTIAVCLLLFFQLEKIMPKLIGEWK